MCSIDDVVGEGKAGHSQSYRIVELNQYGMRESSRPAYKEGCGPYGCMKGYQ